MRATSEDVQLVQALLQLLGAKGLKIDGLWGPRTAQAVTALSADDQALLLTAVKHGRPHLAPLIKDSLGRQGTKREPHFIPWGELTSLAGRVQQELGVPSSYLLLMLRLENKTNEAGVYPEYEGTFQGVAQFNRATWNGLRTKYAAFELPPYTQGVTDTLASLRAAAILYKDNNYSFQRDFPNGALYSDGIAYLYHQQGASAAKRFLTSGRLMYPDQSAQSKALFAAVRSAFLGGDKPTVA